jgi:hypothetical protein
VFDAVGFLLERLRAGCGIFGKLCTQNVYIHTRQGARLSPAVVSLYLIVEGSAVLRCSVAGEDGLFSFLVECDHFVALDSRSTHSR